MNAPAQPAFTRLVEEAAATLRQGQSDLLGHFWRLGELVDRLAKEAPGRTPRHLAEALREHGQEVSAAQLLQAKRIFDRYRAEDLPALVEKGFTVTHLKALLPLDDALRERVEQAALGEDGRVCPTRELQQTVRAERIRSMAVQADDGEDDAGSGEDDGSLDEPAGQAARMASLPAAQTRVVAADPHDGGPIAAPAPVAPGEAIAPVSPIRVGAVASREYSRPPLAVIKRTTGAAETLADSLPGLWTALGEVERIGWDSDRAQQNFREQAELLITAFEALQQIGPTAVARLRAALA